MVLAVDLELVSTSTCRKFIVSFATSQLGQSALPRLALLPTSNPNPTHQTIKVGQRPVEKLNRHLGYKASSWTWLDDRFSNVCDVSCLSSGELVSSEPAPSSKVEH